MEELIIAAVEFDVISSRLHRVSIGTPPALFKGHEFVQPPKTKKLCPRCRPGGLPRLACALSYRIKSILFWCRNNVVEVWSRMEAGKGRGDVWTLPVPTTGQPRFSERPLLTTNFHSAFHKIHENPADNHVFTASHAVHKHGRKGPPHHTTEWSSPHVNWLRSSRINLRCI